MNKMKQVSGFLLLFFFTSVYPNIPPYIQTHINTIYMNEDDTLRLSVSRYFSDSDGVIVRYSMKLPNHVTATTHDSLITLSPKKDFFGFLSGDAVAVDDSGDSVTDHFTLVVRNVNDPPKFIKVINDTSITNNMSDSINLESYVDDIDNPKSDLKISVDAINGMKFSINGFILKITPIAFIDTAHIRLIVTDTFGLSDTTRFDMFTNKPTPHGTSFVFGGKLINRTFSPIHAIRTVESDFYIDKYNDRGQKTSTPVKLNIPNLDKESSFYFSQFEDGKYLFTSNTYSQFFYNFFLDTNFSIIGNCPKFYRGYPVIKQNKDKIFITGKNDSSYLVYLFNYSLDLLRVDTIKTEFTQFRIFDIFINDKTYSVFFIDSRPPSLNDSLDGRIYAQSNNIEDGTVSIQKKMILPYIKSDSARPTNMLKTVLTCKAHDGGYVMLWSFDNSKYDGSGYWVLPNTKVYLLRFNSQLGQIGNYTVLFADTTKRPANKDMNVLGLVPVKNQYFIAFSTGYYNPVYYYGYYNSSFTSSSKIVSESSKYFTGSYEYTLINDSTLFRIEQYYSGTPLGTFLPINHNFQTAIQEIHPQKFNGGNSNLSYLISMHGKILSIEYHGEFTCSIYSLNGKLLFSKPAHGTLSLQLGIFGKSNFIVRLRSKHACYNKLITLCD